LNQRCIEEITPIPCIEDVANVIENFLGLPKHLYLVDNYCVVEMDYFYDEYQTKRLIEILNENTLLLQGLELRAVVNGQTTIIMKRDPLRSASFRCLEFLHNRALKKQKLNADRDNADNQNADKHNAKRHVKKTFLKATTRIITFYHILKTVQLFFGTVISCRHENSAMYIGIEVYENNDLLEKMEESPILLNEIEFRYL
jgi:hypothetical protein